MAAPGGPGRNPDGTNVPPFETEDLRANLAVFLATPVVDPVTGWFAPIGGYTWGVYAFFDYDGEPIYVGQTKEKVSTRIRRHLTNQRTDAVAMNVLDPFEVAEIEVWPLPQFERTPKSDRGAKAHLDALENLVYARALAASRFGAVLNEKNPPPAVVPVELPRSVRATVVSEAVRRIRGHPDFRIARRALVMSRLAQVVAERKVQGGLRRVLLTQAKRLQWLAERRYEALGGEAIVASDAGADED